VIIWRAVTQRIDLTIPEIGHRFRSPGASGLIGGWVTPVRAGAQPIAARIGAGRRGFSARLVMQGNTDPVTPNPEAAG
jgi:hypothetical protein